MKGQRMKPEANSRRLFGITRSKGKMYEFSVPEKSHIEIPQSQVPEELLLLTVGILGDAAARILDFEDAFENQSNEDVRFSASYFDALFSSTLSKSIDDYLIMFASVGYLIGGRPGSSIVMAKMLVEDEQELALKTMLRWLLQADWSEYYTALSGFYGDLLCELSDRITQHFQNGSGAKEIVEITENLRDFVYRTGNDEQVLLCDLVCGVAIIRVASSVWSNIPRFSQLGLSKWEAAIRKKGFPTELWPSQMSLGQAGIFAGKSGVIQMPTSAGKTRSVEIIIRSAFLSGRTHTAVVVAPFRALCHEIKQSLLESFLNEDVLIDELSDSFQADYLAEFEELFGIGISKRPSVVIMTPEKLLYALRQDANIVDGVGLVVYDEGHQFDSGYRGVTYELLLTEIKRLLRSESQTVLISAVIQNASEIAQWLIGDGAVVVQGADLSPTSRATAFASWLDRLGQVMFYEGEISHQRDYFVPRVIEQQQLRLLGRERAQRVFPEKSQTADISLYLGLRLISKGPVAIFCGKKSSAEKIAKRAVEVFQRGLNLVPPAEFSDRAEIEKLKNLFTMHFSEASIPVQAASLGIFAHHGNTPEGLRLSIEFAMQQSLICFVACTSTLAQGVNLPIRYLVVSGVYQGADQIKVRDFHNLMGRAGRSGMHTEGLIIFGDPRIYDERLASGWRFDEAKKLLNPNNTEPTTSSLLHLIKPFRNRWGEYAISLPLEYLFGSILSDDSLTDQWAIFIVQLYPGLELDLNQIENELKYRKSLVHAIESYLMSHRGTLPYEEFQQSITSLVRETLASSLCDSAEDIDILTQLFLAVSGKVEGLVPDVSRQAAFGKTLLGVNQAALIEGWVTANSDQLLTLDTNEALLDAVWNILAEQIGGKFVSTTHPIGLPKNIARKWLEGHPYHEIFDYVKTVDGTKPWGQRRRKLSEEDVMGFCEGSLGFNFPLCVAAISQFLYNPEQLQRKESKPIRFFQKALKYGLSTELAVSTYESGIADRMLSMGISELLTVNGYQLDYFDEAIEGFGPVIKKYLSQYPSYYMSVIETV